MDTVPVLCVAQAVSTSEAININAAFKLKLSAAMMGARSYVWHCHLSLIGRRLIEVVSIASFPFGDVLWMHGSYSESDLPSYGKRRGGARKCFRLNQVWLGATWVV